MKPATSYGAVRDAYEDAGIAEQDFLGLPGGFVALVGVLPVKADFIVIGGNPLLDGLLGWLNGLGGVDLFETMISPCSATSPFAFPTPPCAGSCSPSIYPTQTW